MKTGQEISLNLFSGNVFLVADIGAVAEAGDEPHETTSSDFRDKRDSDCPSEIRRRIMSDWHQFFSGTWVLFTFQRTIWRDQPNFASLLVKQEGSYCFENRSSDVAMWTRSSQWIICNRKNVDVFNTNTIRFMVDHGYPHCLYSHKESRLDSCISHWLLWLGDHRFKWIRSDLFISYIRPP